MKKHIISLLLFSSFFAFTQAQTLNLAETAPKGIVVILGSKIPNGVKVQAIKIEKKIGTTDFKTLTQVKSSATEQEFLAKVNEFKKFFPDMKLPDQEKLKEVWKIAVRTGSLDSIGYMGRIPEVGIALGLYYYDLDVKEKTNYQYRITVNNNGTVNSYTSNIATYPLHPSFDNVILKEYDFSDKGLFIRWFSVGNNPASDFKVYKFVDKNPIEVQGPTSQFKLHDTTFYSIQETNAIAAKTFHYSAVGIDKYGNTAIGSAPIKISAINSNTIYFKKANAKRDNKNLALQLTWRLENLNTIQSIRIFKSELATTNFKELATVKGKDSTYTDTKVVPDKMYYYYLLARDYTGSDSVKSSIFFASGMDKQPIITPQILSATGTQNGVLLTCAVPDNYIKGIKIYRATGINTDFEVIYDLYLTNDSNLVEFIDSSKELSGKKMYSYYIVSQNTSSKQSEKSNILAARPALPTEPEAPAFLRAYYQDDVVNLAWQDVKLRDITVQGYLVMRSPKDKNSWTNLFGTDSIFTGSHFEDTNTEAGNTYDYKIQTVDLFGGKSKVSVSGTVAIPNAVVIPASGLHAINLPQGIQLEWNPAADSSTTSFKVYRYQRGAAPKSIAKIDAQERFFLDKEVNKGDLYFYYITAIDTKLQESDPSDEVGLSH